MELLDRYLQAVRFWLPKAQRDDIAAELSEDIRSQIEERESRHAFWGMDPSGHCTCDDCNAPDGDES